MEAMAAAPAPAPWMDAADAEDAAAAFVQTTLRTLLDDLVWKLQWAFDVDVSRIAAEALDFPAPPLKPPEWPDGPGAPSYETGAVPFLPNAASPWTQLHDTSDFQRSLVWDSAPAPRDTYASEKDEVRAMLPDPRTRFDPVIETYRRRADVPLMNRGDAAAGTRLFRGDEARRGRDADVRKRPARVSGTGQHETHEARGRRLVAAPRGRGDECEGPQGDGDGAADGSRRRRDSLRGGGARRAEEGRVTRLVPGSPRAPRARQNAETARASSALIF